MHTGGNGGLFGDVEDVLQLEIELEELAVGSGEQFLVFLIIVKPKKGISEVEKVCRFLDRTLEVHRVTDAVVPCIVVGDGILHGRNELVAQGHIKCRVATGYGVETLSRVLHLVVGDDERRELMTP